MYCYDTIRATTVRHRMAYVGYGADRDSMRYCCPALHESWDCPSQSRCSARRSYGLTARMPRALDLRRFPPIPQATKEFEVTAAEAAPMVRTASRFTAIENSRPICQAATFTSDRQRRRGWGRTYFGGSAKPQRSVCAPKSMAL